MNNTINEKSQKTCDRIITIRDDLKSYRHSIKLLDDYASGRLTLKGKSYTEDAANYKRTREDEERYRWTKNHLLTRILLLEYELSVLIEYGE
jgi:DNA repair ATPase RecN